MPMTITKNNYMSEVIESGKTVLLDFWAPWCGPCRMIAPTIEEIAQTAPDHVLVGKVNVDEQPELAAKFGVMSIPTIVVVKEGKVTAQAVGVRPKSAILSMLN